MTPTNLEEIVAKVLAELRGAPAQEAPAAAPLVQQSAASGSLTDSLVIDLPDPTTDEPRRRLGVEHPYDADGLRNLTNTTTARLGVGRAGARPKTDTLLLFQADHAVTQDAIYGEVSEDTLAKFDLFTVQTRVEDRQEYLLRPDRGRLLSNEAKATIEQRCVKHPDVQICVGDGLSAAAIDSNLADIFPVLTNGFKAAGLSLGTPFFIQNARVGVMNDVNAIIGAKVMIILIGERPGLGIADAMSAYMGYDPQPGKSDADRDLICMITTHGGTNPLEAGAYVVEFIQKMLKHQASGVNLKLLTGE